MPNDDLGTFPVPPQAPSSPADQAQPESTTTATPTTPEPAFEPTPDEIPTIQPPTVPTSDPGLASEQEKLVAVNENLIEKQAPVEAQPTPASLPQPEPAQPIPAPAALPPHTNKSLAPIIIIVLLIIAGVGVAASVYLSQQTQNLKTQLTDITQTLQKQQNTLTPTPTPTVFEITTPTPTASLSGVVTTLSATPTTAPTTITNLLKPLGNAGAALQMALNHSPNAQLILIKVDSAENASTAVTKYFFRQDLTTKTYFYVAISGTGEPQIIDKQIYVTPDDNIPSLNNAVLTGKMGVDLDAALKLTYSLCANQITCVASPAKAQYIATATGIIWQISIYTQGLTGNPLVAQIDALTQAVLYKSDGFATLAK